MATYYAQSIWLQDVTVKVEVADAENFWTFALSDSNVMSSALSAIK